MLSNGTVITLTIKNLAASGAGVGFYEDDTTRAVFVPLTAPGDVVEAKITANKKAYYEATIHKIITPSSHRITPPCPYVGECGACDWLHVSYDEQVRQKEQLLRYAFSKQGVSLPSVEIIPAEEQYHYRCKVRFPGNGFSARRSNTIVKVEKCWLLDHRLQSILSLSHAKGECWGVDKKTDRATQEEASYLVEGKDIHYHPAGFVQANFAMNRKLVELVAKEASGKTLELYAGNGNFTLTLASRCERVVAIEGSRESHLLLLGNLERQGIRNVLPLVFDAREYLEGNTESYDCIVLDPPRSGMGEALAFAVGKTKKIIYVSCDASELARDLKRYILSSGFRLERISMLDLFPQTRHFETVAVLTKE
jgi:23S rRNA (uracil1939-C5)-methyltransferase